MRFVIADTGPGLNDEQKARLFQRFEQAEGARTAARYGGSGLGLAICQELAAAMGGRIVLDSVPGQGTDFTVDLPLPGRRLRRRPRRCRSARARTARCTCCWSRTTPLSPKSSSACCRRRATPSCTRRMAWRRCPKSATTGFDLALLDLDLPGLDGLALARQLRGQGIAIPLLAVTARADADAEPLARAAGFDGFLRKPLTGAMLAEAIEALLPTADPGDTAAR